MDFFGTLIFVIFNLTLITSLPNYWDLRSSILRAEKKYTVGGNLDFEAGERIANDILMTEKYKELSRGLRYPSEFAPARSFLNAKSDIENSKVYQMIRKMPKGAVLHVHDTALVSADYIFDNITHRDNLYICEIGNNIDEKILSMRFFDKPNNECDWKLLSEIRRDPTLGKSFDERIRRQMSMNDDSTGNIFTDGNAAWKKFVGIFSFITPFLTYRNVYEDHYYQGLKELHEDNVIYLELRSTLPTLYDLDGTTYGPIEVARIYKNITDRFVRENPNFIGARFIYAPGKTNDSAIFEGYVTIAAELRRELPNFVAGFDLVGQEDTSTPLSVWVDKIRSIDQHVPFFFHAGETNWNGMSIDENLIDAVLLNTTRIGHGYALSKHPKVLEFVKKKKIAIEICPISNQVLALVRDMRNHPANELFVNDVPVVISNDDPGLWGARGLSYDFYEAFVGIMSAHADIRSIKQLAMNSLNYSSLCAEEKERALRVWREQWNSFLETIQAENSAILN